MAKKRVGILHMLLTADTRKFNRGMRQVKRQLKAMSNAVAKASIRLAKFGAVAAIGAAAGLAVLVKKSFAALDVIAKTSDRLNISTQALIGFQNAANKSGISSETLTKGLERMNVAIGEVSAGLAEEAKAAFDLLGLSAESLDKMDGGKAFELIAERIGQIGSASKQAAVANDIFGRAGKKLINLFSSGREGLRGYREEIRKIGGLFSRQQLAGIEAANDAFDTLKKSITAAADRIAIDLAPMVLGLSTAFTSLGGELFGVGSLFGSAMGLIAGSALFAVDAIENATKRLRALPHDVADFFGVSGQPASGKQHMRFRGEANTTRRDIGTGKIISETTKAESGIGKIGDKTQAVFDRMMESLNKFGDEMLARSLKAKEMFHLQVGAGRGISAIPSIAQNVIGGGLGKASELGVVGGQSRFGGGGGVHSPTTKGIQSIAEESKAQTKLLRIIANRDAGLVIV